MDSTFLIVSRTTPTIIIMDGESGSRGELIRRRCFVLLAYGPDSESLGHTAAHVVGEGEEIHRAIAQGLGIAGLHFDLHIVLGPDALCKGRICTAHLHVTAVVVAVLPGMLVLDLILRVGRVGIVRSDGHHAADLIFRVDAVAQLH